MNVHLLIFTCPQVIHTIDHYKSEAGRSEIRALELATVTRDNSSSGCWDPPTTGILVTQVCHQKLSGLSGAPRGRLLSGVGVVHPEGGSLATTVDDVENHGDDMREAGGETSRLFEVHSELGIGLTLDHGGHLNLW